MFVKARCFCEHKNGGPGRNGILCEEKKNFVKSSSCKMENQICSGPTTKEEAVIGTKSLCTEGKQAYLIHLCYHKTNKKYTLLSFNVSWYNLLGVYCGDGNEWAISCNECVRTNDTVTNNWCGGDCIFDHVTQTCTEGQFIINLISY